MEFEHPLFVQEADQLRQALETAREELKSLEADRAQLSSKTQEDVPLVLMGHTGSVLSVSFSPDGKRIVSGSWDNTVKVWDAQTGQETFTLKGHSSGVHSVSFSPDGKRIASGGDDRTVKIWDISSLDTSK